MLAGLDDVVGDRARERALPLADREDARRTASTGRSRSRPRPSTAAAPPLRLRPPGRGPPPRLPWILLSRSGTRSSVVDPNLKGALRRCVVPSTRESRPGRSTRGRPRRLRRSGRRRGQPALLDLRGQGGRVRDHDPEDLAADPAHGAGGQGARGEAEQEGRDQVPGRLLQGDHREQVRARRDQGVPLPGIRLAGQPQLTGADRGLGRSRAGEDHDHREGPARDREHVRDGRSSRTRARR